MKAFRESSPLEWDEYIYITQVKQEKILIQTQIVNYGCKREV